MTKLSRNIVFNLFGQLLTLALSFVAVRLVFRRLGGDALGIIYFTQTVAALVCASLSMGVGATTVREVAGHHLDDPTYVRDWVRTASTIYWSLVALLAAVLWSAVPVLVRHWINLATMSELEAVRALRILAMASLLALPRSLYTSVIRGLERMDVTNGLEVAVMAVRQAGAIAILSHGGGVFAVIWWLAGCHLLFLAACAIGAAGLLSPAALVPGFSAAAIRRNLRYALGAMGVTIFGAIRVQGDRVIVSKMLPLETLGVYSFAYGAAWKGRLLATAISRAALPSFSALFAAGQRDALMSQYRKLHDVVCWSMAPLLAALPFAAAPLFTCVFSRGTARVMHLPVALLCSGIYMSSTLTVPHTLVMASGRPGIVVRFTSRAVFVVLPATALLIYRYGLVGAAISCACYPVAVYLCVVPRICRECTDFSAWSWYRHIARVLAAIALTYGAAWGVLFRLELQSIPALALAYSAATMVYGIAAWLMIGPELKGTIKGHASRLLGGPKRGKTDPGEGE